MANPTASRRYLLRAAGIAALAVPPAWTDVWITPHANGHLQAVGTDAKGRRQYLYHERWHSRQGELKHQRVLLLGAALPKARERARHRRHHRLLRFAR